MKKSLIALVLVSIWSIFGCSESTTPSNQANVKITGEIAAVLVSEAGLKEQLPNIQLNEVDSIKISRVRILMTELKLYKSSEDSSGDGKVLKSGPFVFDVSPSGVLIELANGSVVPGIYDKIKLEFHRFSSNETNKYTSDPVFKDFATNDRYSVIIEGKYYKSNIPTDFSFKAQTTANVLLKFNSAIDLTDGSTTTFAVQTDPNLFFKKGTSILDPTAAKNFNDIENAIKSTLKSVKK